MNNYLLCVCAVLILFSFGTAAQGQTPAPNIVYLLADDMGLGDTSAYQDLTNNADAFQVATPNMERLAAMGTRFTDFHSGASVCTPTRLSLLTGTHAFRGVARQLTSRVNQDTIATLFPGTRRTFAHMLQDAGYGTYGIGKWHTGLQVTNLETPSATADEIHEGAIESGFDGYTGLPGNYKTDEGMMEDNDLVTFSNTNFDTLVATGTTGSISPTNPPDESYLRHIQQAQLDAAQAYLTNHVANRSDEPFLLYFASHSNHTPYVPARESNATGPTATAELEGVTLTGNTKAGGYLNVPILRNASGDPILDANGNPQVDPNDPNYNEIDPVNHWAGDDYDYITTDANNNPLTHGPGERFKMIQENDVILGKLLDYLEATDDPRNPGKKLIDNTLVIFSSDNGSDIKSEPSVGALPQPGDETTFANIAGKKATPEEGGSRVPFIAAWGNNIAANSTSDALFGTNDIYATLAELAGQDLISTEAVDSESAVSALLGTETGVFRDTDLVYKNRERLIIRRGNLKLVAADPDANRQGSRFDGNIDFVGMVVDKFYDLGEDLTEAESLLRNDGTWRNTADQAQYAATMADMLSSLQGYVDAGFTRSGAEKVNFGKNFQGGDILEASDYSSYAELNNDTGGPDFEPNVLTTDTPSFVFMDGTADGKVDGAWLIHGNGEVIFAADKQAGLDNGSIYEMRGGGLDATAANVFRVDNGSALELNGKDAMIDITGKDLRFQNGTGVVDLKEGEIVADRLVFNSDGGIFRFGEDAGVGLLTLLNANPFVFSQSGSSFIDFDSDAMGMLVCTQKSSFFSGLWDAGRLRIDGVVGNQGEFGDFFTVEPGSSAGTFALSLTAVSMPNPILLCDANLDGVVNFLDISAFIAVLTAGEFLAQADCDQDGDVDFSDIPPFIARLIAS